MRSGAIYLFEGPLPSRAEPFAPEDIAIVSLRGTTDREWTGSGVGVIDANRDGVLDIVVGVDEDDRVTGNGGRVYFIEGPISEVDGVLFDVATPLLHGHSGYELGTSLNGHLDLDGDGWPDLLVGVAAGPGSRGAAVGLLTTSPPSEVAYGDSYFQLHGTDSSVPANRRGVVEAAVVGDLDGGGRPDIAIGQPGPEGAAGAVLVFLGEGGITSGEVAEVADLRIEGGCAALLGFGASVLSR